MDRFSTTAPATGVPEQLLQDIIDGFTVHGFKIAARDDAAVSLIGPGLNSTRENPLLGASKVEVQLVDDEVVLEAELGGVDRMRRFLTWFPLILGGVLAIFFAVLFLLLSGPSIQALGGSAIALLAVSPWLVLSPWISSKVKTRTEEALRVALNNATIRRHRHG